MNKKEMTSLLESNLKTRLEGLWANINAKKKRGEKSAPKGSKAYKAAKKAGDKLEKTKEGFELEKEKFTDPDQMRMNNEAVYDKMLKAVPKFYSYKAFAADVAKMIKQEYGSHLIKGFIKELTKHLMSKDESVNEGTEAFKKGDKVKYLGHPAIITKVKEYNGRLFYSVSYNKGSGKTKASNILSTDGTITEGAISPRDAKKLSIGDTIKTQKNKYKITGYGSKSNAFRQFEAEDAKGNKYNIQVSLRGNSDIGVASGRSLRFSDEMVATIYRDRF